LNEAGVEERIKLDEVAFADPLTYDFGRFSYSTELEVDVLKKLQICDEDYTASSDIIELGAGTGKFTKQVLKTAPTLERRWTAIEPVRSMREIMVKKLCKTFPMLRVVEAVAENIPAQTNTACAVICAQSFH